MFSSQLFFSYTNSGSMKKFCILFVLAVLCFKKAFCNYDNVQIVDNGYEGIVIAINPNVPEDQSIIDSLKVGSKKISKNIFTWKIKKKIPLFYKLSNKCISFFNYKFKHTHKNAFYLLELNLQVFIIIFSFTANLEWRIKVLVCSHQRTPLLQGHNHPSSDLLDFGIVR